MFCSGRLTFYILSGTSSGVLMNSFQYVVVVFASTSDDVVMVTRYMSSGRYRLFVPPDNLLLVCSALNAP